MHRGFIRLWRKTADSQSASRGANHIAMMAWLLMQANWSEKFVNGIRIDRGQLLTSVAKLSAELRISVQSVRTVLHNLTTDGFLTIKSTNKYSIVTICNFNTYQVDENADQQTNQQTSNKQATNKQQQQYNNKNNKNNYNNMCCSPDNIYINNIIDQEDSNTATKAKEKKKRTTASKPSSAQEVIDYCKKRNNGIDGQYFWDKMEARGWCFKDGRPVKDWQACVRTWERYNNTHEQNNTTTGFDRNTRATYPGDENKGKEFTNGF